MHSDMTVVNEGFTLDDLGNMVSTMYVDCREENGRTAIPGLVKGCKREHALEDGESLLISSPARFREEGEKLIRDINEGFAQEVSVSEAGETPAQARKRRTIEDLNEASEILNSRFSLKRKVSFSGTNTERKNLKYGNDWWVFCTSIEPDDEEWEPWRATLDDEYNHVSRIGQPSKFAQALARMVIETLGPQGEDAWLNHSVGGKEVGRTNHLVQQVIHGPVMYTDGVYDFLSDPVDNFKKMIALIFTKNEKFAAQREYRFAILNGGADQETVLLPISGMMRDSLKLTESGLIRIAPSRSATAENDSSETPSMSNSTPKLVSKRSTKTNRLTSAKESRLETRTPEGQVLSSEGERQEQVLESVVTHKYGAADEDSPFIERIDEFEGVPAKDRPKQWDEQQRGKRDRDLDEEEVVQEIAQKEREWGGGSPRENDWTIPVRSGTGRVYKSMKVALSDPAFPMGIGVRAWQDELSSHKELTRTLGAIEILALKIPDLPEEDRQDAASAGWHAIYCIRNICARLGDIVESIWIERGGFVVIRLKDSKELKAEGRIVVSPSGAYAYCLRGSNNETIGSGGEIWGTLFFPGSTEIESLETLGWPATKEKS